MSYLPYLTLLGASMASTIVLTSMMSQTLALGLALIVYDEPLTRAQGFGVVAALVATLAFTLPTAARG